MTDLRQFQRRIAALTWCGAMGLVFEAFLLLPWYGNLWQVGPATALVVAVAAVPAFRGNVLATRGLAGGLACAAGASIVQLFWFIPGWPIALPAAINPVLLGSVALATTAILSYGFIALLRRRRELNGIAHASGGA